MYSRITVGNFKLFLLNSKIACQSGHKMSLSSYTFYCSFYYVFYPMILFAVFPIWLLLVVFVPFVSWTMAGVPIVAFWETHPICFVFISPWWSFLWWFSWDYFPPTTCRGLLLRIQALR